MKGRLDFVCFFIVFRSVVFVNRGGKFVVKHVKIEGFEFGPVLNFQENHDEKSRFWEVIFGLPRSLKSLENLRYFNDFHICKCMVFL